MNTPNSAPRHDPLDDEAAAWLCERDEGFARGRAQAFADWRARNGRHAAAVARVEASLALLGEMPAVRAALETRVGHIETLPVVNGVASRRRIPFPMWSIGLAAALIVGVFGWWLAASRIGRVEHYATNASAPQRVLLRDGSVVDLNAGSTIRVELISRERRVTLVAGEAHFQVAPDRSRPFVVSAGSVAVRAVGTAFNVRLAEELVDVLVVEGKVEVAPRQLPNAVTDTRPSAPILAAGERVVVSRETPAIAPTVEKVEPTSIRTLLAWQEQMTGFLDIPLREIVARFNRHNTTQLVLEDAALGERRVGGVIALDQVDAFVRLLVQDGDIVAESRGANEVLLRRAH